MNSKQYVIFLLSLLIYSTAWSLYVGESPKNSFSHEVHDSDADIECQREECSFVDPVRYHDRP